MKRLDWFGAIFGLVAGALVGAQPAFAAISSVTITAGTVTATSPAGVFIKLDPENGPFTVGSDNFNTNDLYGFNEQQNVALASDLTVFLGEGHGTTTLPKGTFVSSHYFVFDSLEIQTVAATLVFDQGFLGFARSAAQLTSSNSLGASGVTYTSPPFVGLEPGFDFLTFNPASPNQVKILLSNSSPGDVFRVFTAGLAPASPPAGVPEPATWGMMICGFMMAGSALRRRTGARTVSA